MKSLYVLHVVSALSLPSLIFSLLHPLIATHEALESCRCGLRRYGDAELIMQWASSLHPGKGRCDVNLSSLFADHDGREDRKKLQNIDRVQNISVTDSLPIPPQLQKRETKAQISLPLIMLYSFFSSSSRAGVQTEVVQMGREQIAPAAAAAAVRSARRPFVGLSLALLPFWALYFYRHVFSSLLDRHCLPLITWHCVKGWDRNAELALWEPFSKFQGDRLVRSLHAFHFLRSMNLTSFSVRWHVLLSQEKSILGEILGDYSLIFRLVSIPDLTVLPY